MGKECLSVVLDLSDIWKRHTFTKSGKHGKKTWLLAISKKDFTHDTYFRSPVAIFA